MHAAYIYLPPVCVHVHVLVHALDKGSGSNMGTIIGVLVALIVVVGIGCALYYVVASHTCYR